MILIYTIINLFMIYIAKNKYKMWINPISGYCLVWEISVFIHESGLILYYELSTFSWLIIIGMQVLYMIFCLFGININNKCFRNDIIVDRIIQKKEMKKYIYISTFLAGCAIITNLFFVISIYGTDLVSQMMLIYSDRVDQTQVIDTIPYLGSFLLIATSLLGIYLKKFGFTMLIPIVFCLTVISALNTGGRANIVFALLTFGLSYYITIDDYSNRKSSFFINRKAFFVIGLISLIFFVFLMSNHRSEGITLFYATDQFKNIFGDNSVLYKILIYISGPIGVLNEYLYNCDFEFGKNTFLPIYNILSRVGLIDKIAQYQNFYYVPVECNVGTWIRELVEDFTISGAMIVIALFSTITSSFFLRAKKEYGVRFKTIGAILMMIVCLSFFDWRLRSASLWIAIGFGYFFSYKIDKNSIKNKR